MRKYLLLFIIAVFAMSCSKKVEVKGKISGGSPLERIEFIEASGVATLPLINIGINKDGTFAGSFEAPKSGMYVMSYGGKQNLIYLKGGQKLEIAGNGMTFPSEYTITGDAKNNNDFFTATQKYLSTYAQKVNMNELMAKDEKTFLKGIEKVQADINKNIEENVQKFNPDNEIVQWKKNDLSSTLLTILNQYEMSHKQMGNPSFKVTKAFTDFENKLQENKEVMVKENPYYRQYLLGKMSPDFQKYAQANSAGKTDITTSELFTEYLKKNQKDLSQTTKDYLLAFVMAQSDIHPGSPEKTIEKIKKIIDTDIKDATIKEDLKKIQFAINGFKIGEQAPDASLIKADGKSYSLSSNKGKPYMMMFYASWNPYIGEASIPVLKEVINFYKSKMNFVFINVDDTKDQFVKTSNSLMKGITGTNVYGEGGLNSDIAKKYGVYGFKLPCFIVVDKDGKIASKPFFNLGDPELVTVLDKQTGLSAPKVNPNVQLQPGSGMDPAAAGQQAPQQQANPQPSQTK
ncbi:Thiol-disulfide isomerase or thioredoxin [Chryseobacterium taichungense]|uniref:Thiol-disulfide isomerase or thioredoxin n=1 Tax=Chryseobacterium taichungense TaxID=295069 RepID=A0A1H7WCA2_9FLAO|nr:TlpA disulfide reductase family protein [Chryseobacterium taichungense]SEM19120.1 Thiol-disulfide isomerase or thioredoxin [Chryseobacterium taichungense]